MSYLESDLKTELRDTFRGSGCCCEKFPDNARGVIKPYDLVLGFRGRHIAIETKLTKIGTKRAFSLRRSDLHVVRWTDVRVNQARSLDVVARAGSHGFVGAGLYEQYNGDRECWMIPWDLFKTKDLWTLGDLLHLQPPHLVWRKGSGWDVSSFLEFFSKIS